MTITKLMRETLHVAHKQPLRRPMLPGPGAPPWPAPWQTILALEKRGLLTRVVIRHNKGHFVWIWDLSEAGRLVLYPPPVVKEDRPSFMTRGAMRYRKLPNGRWAVITDPKDEDSDRNEDDYTSDPSRSIDELEVVPQASEAWRRRAERSRLGAKDRRQLARDLARQARRAA